MNIIEKINKFYKDFKGEKGIFGYSTRNRPLYYFCIKKSEYPIVLIQYSIHAREYITSYLALSQIQDFIKNGDSGKVYFLPMLNPDGVDICLTLNPLFKANANFVDLNVNFDAEWGKGKSNIHFPYYENYIGAFPNSEKETQALTDFTKRTKPNITVSYHSKGEEIYYKFNQSGSILKRDFEIAQTLSEITGYTVKETPDSCGGYKDWCIRKMGIPAFTVEVGNDLLKHPIDKKYLPEIFKKNKGVLSYLTHLSNI